MLYQCFVIGVLLCLLMLSVILSSTIVFAYETWQREFYFGGDLGVVNMNLQRNDISYSDIMAIWCSKG